MIIYLNVKHEILEENIREKLSDLGLSTQFLK